MARDRGKAVRVAPELAPLLEAEAKARRIAATAVVNEVLAERYAERLAPAPKVRRQGKPRVERGVTSGTPVVPVVAAPATPTERAFAAQADAAAPAAGRAGPGKCVPSCPVNRLIGGVCTICGTARRA